MVKFTCNFLRFVQANRGTSLGPGRERAQARHRARATLLVVAALPPCAAVAQLDLEVWAWALYASAPHTPPGHVSAGEPARHAACACSPWRRRSARRARTSRVAVPHVLMRWSRHCEALRPACVLGYKRPPSSSPAREPAARRPAIAAAAGELTAPLAPAADQTLLALY
jgi:hypothetical protein